MSNPEGLPKEESHRESSISEIIGLEAEQEKKNSDTFEALFNGHIKSDAEREKTKEENRAIQHLLDTLPSFIEKYGGNPIINITLDHVHILERDKLDEKVKSFFDNQGGGYSTVDQYLYIVDQHDLLINLETICHELLHLHSFQSIWYKQSRKEEQWQPWYEWYDLRRVGFEVHLKDNGETIFFKDLNEAITEELVRRFDAENFADISDVSEAVQKRDRMKKISPTMFSDLSVITEKDSNISLRNYSYPEDRRKLNKIIQDIFEKNKSELDSPEAIFDIFAQAAMSGKLLPVARLIEKTYGKGSFRKLGEETKTKST